MFVIALILSQAFLLPLSQGILTRRNFIQTSLQASLAISNNPSISNYSNPILSPDLEDNEKSKLMVNGPAKKIYFTGEVNDETCLAILQSIHTIQHQFNPTQVDHIDLYIQSKGGSLLPALGLADWIINSDVPIYTWVSGYAASAATLLSAVGSKRFMTKHSVILLHQLSMGMDFGKFQQIKDQYENGVLLMDLIKQIYLDHSKLESEQLDEILLHDKWLNSSEALEYGLVDVVV